MDDEDTRTIWCGNLHEKVSEDILYELFMQGGPVQKVSIPKDRDGKQKTFGFVTYKHVCSVPYALDLFDGTTLFNRPLNMKSRNNSVDNSYLQQQQQGNMYDNRQRNVQNELQLGQQILLGAIAPLQFAPNSMFLTPASYPSQTSLYSQSPQNDYWSNRQQNRNHPYQDRDRHNNRHNHDRHNNRQESFGRDIRHKHSSHRSYRHDEHRKRY